MPCSRREKLYKLMICRIRLKNALMSTDNGIGVNHKLLYGTLHTSVFFALLKD